MKGIKFGMLGLIFFCFFSCTDDRCNLDTESLVKAEFEVKKPALNQSKFLDSLSVYSPEWPDSLHNLENGSAKDISFMLSPASDTTQLIFTSGSVLPRDTIFFYYHRNLVFLSPECGFIVNFSIDSLYNTGYNIDSIKIKTKEVTTNDDGSIQIYF